jgi:hypothetical protein
VCAACGADDAFTLRRLPAVERHRGAFFRPAAGCACKEAAGTLSGADLVAVPQVKQIASLRVLQECGCGDDFCQSFYTQAHRTAPTAPATGMSV